MPCGRIGCLLPMDATVTNSPRTFPCCDSPENLHMLSKVSQAGEEGTAVSGAETPVVPVVDD